MNKNNYITWLYFLIVHPKQENEKVIFLYGLSLPTSSQSQDTQDKYINIDENKLIACFTTITESLLLQNNELNFNGFIKIPP